MYSNSCEEFEQRCEAKRKEGLLDLKFCTTNQNSTPEDFCAEANSIDDALDRGDFSLYSFGDASGPSDK